MTETTTFECLICGKETETGTFCGETCEKVGPEAQALVDAQIRAVMLEAMCWQALREAKETGIWN